MHSVIGHVWERGVCTWLYYDRREPRGSLPVASVVAGLSITRGSQLHPVLEKLIVGGGIAEVHIIDFDGQINLRRLVDGQTTGIPDLWIGCVVCEI